MREDFHPVSRERVLGLDDQADRRSLVMLCDLIHQHIRFEEREFFVYLESLLNPEKLDEIFVKLEKHPLGPEEWKDEFWVKKRE
ncbi:MAG: hypothetical protein FJY20_06680 [Bacteroidetes bacterium]|nr:hypothetical protein [Bacteroidota bacterium]